MLQELTADQMWIKKTVESLWVSNFERLDQLDDAVVGFLELGSQVSKRHNRSKIEEQSILRSRIDRNRIRKKR